MRFVRCGQCQRSAPFACLAVAAARGALLRLRCSNCPKPNIRVVFGERHSPLADVERILRPRRLALQQALQLRRCVLRLPVGGGELWYADMTHWTSSEAVAGWDVACVWGSSTSGVSSREEWPWRVRCLLRGCVEGPGIWGATKPWPGWRGGGGEKTEEGRAVLGAGLNDAPGGGLHELGQPNPSLAANLSGSRSSHHFSFSTAKPPPKQPRIPRTLSYGARSPFRRRSNRTTVS